jgi:ABC-type molybdate transport system substrate-binding protein
VSGFITVVVAEPLAPSVRRIARAFEAANPIASVTVEAATTGVVQQLRAGRGGDVFATASTAEMDQVVGVRTYGDPVRFGRDGRRVASAVMLDSTGDQGTSRAFIAFTTTPTAQRVLDRAGFEPTH